MSIPSLRCHTKGTRSQADGRKPPVAFRTEGARAAERVASALAGPFARGLPPGGSSSGRAEAPGCVSHRRCARSRTRRHRVVRAVYPRAAAQWHWLCGRSQCREGEAPAEPHPCCERCTDPCCSVKLLAIVDRADPMRWLGRSLALPGLHPSFYRTPENFNALGLPPGG